MLYYITKRLQKIKQTVLNAITEGECAIQCKCTCHARLASLCHNSTISEVTESKIYIKERKDYLLDR